MFIQFTLLDGSPILVNMQHIKYAVKRFHEGMEQSTLTWVDDSDTQIQESLLQIRTCIPA